PRTCSKTTSERKAELIVRHAQPGVLVQPRHAHAQEPHRAPRIEAAQELEGDRPDGPSVVDGGVEAAGTRHGAEVVEPDLDADRAAAPLLARQRLAQLAREALQDRLELGKAVEVAVEGGLARLRLGAPDGLDGARVLAARERGEMGSEPRPEPLCELLVGRGAQASERGDAELLEPRDGLRPDAGH